MPIYPREPGLKGRVFPGQHPAKCCFFGINYR